jgi:hypothetical protein
MVLWIVGVIADILFPPPRAAKLIKAMMLK